MREEQKQTEFDCFGTGGRSPQKNGEQTHAAMLDSDSDDVVPESKIAHND